MQPKDLQRFYENWKTGLLCCMPASLRRIVDPQTAPIILQADNSDKLRVYQAFDGKRNELGTLSFEHPGASQRLLKSLKSTGKSLILRLPDDWLLKKRARFPAAAENNLRQVIGFEMDRLTPFPAAQVFYDFRIVERVAESGELILDLAILPRKRLQSVLTQLKKAGLQIHIVDALDSWDGINLLPPDERPKSSKLEIASTLSLWVLVALLILAILGTPLWQKRKIVIELEARAHLARQQATQITALRSKVDEGIELLNRVPERRSQIPSSIDVIRDLTNLLPDDTWVQQLELKKGHLTLRGMSRQATSLIQTLENAPGFHHVAFRSPVLQAQGEERFHLSAELFSEDLMVSGQ